MPDHFGDAGRTTQRRTKAHPADTRPSGSRDDQLERNRCIEQIGSAASMR